ncbi:hypothetical protein ALC60_06153 [Trachymyrmex zeteki]|uniref:Uncharacterized protein n=1 Tax=Mycetomoellerius zeteki TaxID=64791 RepID=A0A151X3G3_9HYME|nr:hypothetical protein ALC60_06153 [Trachymyrmex zeteki]
MEKKRDGEECEICERGEKERKKKSIETKRANTHTTIMFGNQPARQICTGKYRAHSVMIQLEARPVRYAYRPARHRSAPDKVETKDEKPTGRQEKNEDRGSGDDNDSDDDRRLVITIRVRAR